MVDLNSIRINTSINSLVDIYINMKKKKGKLLRITLCTHNEPKPTTPLPWQLQFETT